MKFEKPFHIKVQPYYVIKEPTTEEEKAERDLTTRELGGLIIEDERPEGENVTILSRSSADIWW